ncbi:ATP-dependent nuclease [Mycobacterium colombiense]|uniref:ATP-dependent nuclease n=1 Tax=Mycobacterium colombiense TaxID=339268 RepID=UPI0009BC9DD8|nr:AAA family ATPase [Mycobacterium colombiense]
MSHDDEVRRLASKFTPSNRYPNFGPVVQTLEIRGFRGVSDLTINFESPVTAFSGLNGTGKSTVAQLITCAYRKEVTAAISRFYVKDFFPVSAADPAPFTPDAQVIYSYCVERGADPQRVTVSRKAKEWSGYKRQPERSCYYIGFTQFIPKVEKRDLSIYGGHLLELGASRPLSEEAADNVSKILSLPYDELAFTEVTHRSRSAELAMATRNGRSYSENHMGFGEGRVVYMVNTMESAPAQSLFVLEEPETSLHGDAQRRLARYLVEVSSRRGHQIILTTHSSPILMELGRSSVVYLKRHPDGSIAAVTGLSTYQIDSYLQGPLRDNRKAAICVEDAFARHFAIEILRKCNPDLLAGSTIIPIGSAQSIPAAVKILRDAGLRAVGLYDGDVSRTGEFLHKLPGDVAPEKVVFGASAVQGHFAKDPYGISVAELLTGTSDHHSYPSVLAARLMLDESYVTTEACRVYASASDDEFRSIKDFLEGHLSDRR